LLLLGGLRRGEAVGLQWRDLDLDTGTLTVNRQVISFDGELIVGPPKSDAGHRTVPLDRATRDQLRLRQRRSRIRWAWEPDESFVSRFVFTRSDGGCYQPGYVSRHFTTLVNRHGLPRIRLHDLRHTSASLGLEGGESLLEVSRRLGHSSIGITADTYAHVSANTARESTERLAALIDGRREHPAPEGTR
jgi:integrase